MTTLKRDYNLLINVTDNCPEELRISNKNVMCTCIATITLMN